MSEVARAFYSAKDIITMLGISKSAAYDLIKELNKELSADGYHVIRGRVSKRYFDKTMYLED